MVPSSVRCYTFAVGGAGGGGVGGDAPGGAQMNASCFLPSSLSLGSGGACGLVACDF